MYRVDLTNKQVLFHHSQTVEPETERVTGVTSFYRCPKCKGVTSFKRKIDVSWYTPIMEPFRPSSKFKCKHCNELISAKDYTMTRISRETKVLHSALITESNNNLKLIIEELSWNCGKSGGFYVKGKNRFTVSFTKDKRFLLVHTYSTGKSFSNMGYEIYGSILHRIEKIDEMLEWNLSKELKEELSRFYTMDFTNLGVAATLPIHIKWPKASHIIELEYIDSIINTGYSPYRKRLINIMNKIERLEGKELLDALFYGARGKVKPTKSIKRIIAESPKLVLLYQDLIDLGLRDPNYIYAVLQRMQSMHVIKFFRVIERFPELFEIAGRTNTPEKTFARWLFQDILSSQDAARMWGELSDEGKNRVDVRGSIKHVHDEIVRIYNEEEMERRIIRERELLAERKERIKSCEKRYKRMIRRGEKLKYSKDGQSIHVVREVEELSELGITFHNCVGSYKEAMLYGESLILHSTDNGKDTSCIELMYDGKDTFTLTQARAHCNKKVSDKTKEFLLDWCQEKGIRINKKI